MNTTFMTDVKEALPGATTAPFHATRVSGSLAPGEKGRSEDDEGVVNSPCAKRVPIQAFNFRQPGKMGCRS